jgi:hypothetical protein
MADIGVTELSAELDRFRPEGHNLAGTVPRQVDLGGQPTPGPPEGMIRLGDPQEEEATAAAA